MATKAVGDDDFQAQVLEAGKPVLVDFWAEWCAPCKQIGPSLEEISEELADKLDIVKVNIEDSPEVAAKAGVRNIPFLVLYKDGEIADTRLGAAPKAAIKGWLEGAL